MRLLKFIIIFYFIPSVLVAQSSSPDTIVTLKDIVVLASRKPESLMAAPVSTQLVGKRFFENSAASSFFDALANVKGIQMITPSMGFRILNSRGFNNTTNVRFVQTVDGLDIQSPHIGSPIGNALGPSDLDIDKVELMPGVAATLYGMNAINGLADFTTRDPFTDKGLSVMQKTGMTNTDGSFQKRLYSETSIRYANTIGTHWAYKANITYMHGNDWVADNQQDLNSLANASTGLLGATNPAADLVNRYGDESSNRKTLTLGGKSYVVGRTGYFESEVADYSIRNIKGDAIIKWRNNNGSEISYTFRGTIMDNIYQRSNRFRLQDYFLQQHAIQFNVKGVKGNLYYNSENTGNSYNLRSMAENLDRSYKTDATWFSDYTTAFNSLNNGFIPIAQLHQMARIAADNGRYASGSASFQEELLRLQQINNWDMGAALKVRAAFIQADLQWNASDYFLKSFKHWSGIDLIAGFDIRQNITYSDGNYFINPFKGQDGKPILYKKTGAYISMNRDFLHKKMRIGFALRGDKNDFFKTTFSPRLTTTWRPSSNTTFRLNAQLGYRFPIIFEAFSNVNSGGVKRVGGLPVMSNGIFENGWLQTSITAFQSAVLKDVNTSGIGFNNAVVKNAALLKKNAYSYLKPEKVKSIEAGFRQLLWGGKMLIDADVYFNSYHHFIAQVNMNVPNTSNIDSIPYYLYDKSKQKPYRMWTNSTTIVQNYGYSVGITYTHPRSILVSSNVVFTKLTKKQQQDGLEDGFNTPSWSSTITCASNDMWKHWKTGITWRWQDHYSWVSFLVSGEVPAYQTIDAFIGYHFNAQPIKIKLGGSNILHKPYQSFLGGPSVGGFYYLSLTFGMK